jgi:hypothetical protein
MQPRHVAAGVVGLGAILTVLFACRVSQTAWRYETEVSTATPSSESDAVSPRGIRRRPFRPRAACFAPGTPPDILEQYDDAAAYSAIFRWATTASGPTGSSGYPITLTYSFVPDGVDIPNSGIGEEETSPNVLNATLAMLFGSAEEGKNHIRLALARWTELTGVDYVEESNDDGAPFPDTPGHWGARGDVRIAMRVLDGADGVLAFNYYPNLGDMVLDADEDWNDAADSYRYFRNTVMHESGHGLGLGHVYPIDLSKLMEPMLSTFFDGPQDDDIRGSQDFYGDIFEQNAWATHATSLGTVDGTLTAFNAAVNSEDDADWYRFTVAGPQNVSIKVSPVGSTYEVGGASDYTPTINTKAVADLGFHLRSPDGSTILAAVDQRAAGQDEVISVSIPAAGMYYVDVFASASSGPQRYDLTVTDDVLSDPCGPDVDGNGIGDSCESQIALSDCPGDITTTADGTDGASVSWQPPTVTGAYGPWTLGSTHEPGSFFSVGETEVTYTATDAMGRSALCRFRVIVNETMVAGETVEGGGWCGFGGSVTYAFMVTCYVLVLAVRRR